MITNFKCFLLNIGAITLIKREPYNISYFVHKRWISVKLQLENDFLQFLAKIVILEVNALNGEPIKSRE